MKKTSNNKRTLEQKLKKDKKRKAKLKKAAILGIFHKTQE